MASQCIYSKLLFNRDVSLESESDAIYDFDYINTCLIYQTVPVNYYSIFYEPSTNCHS